MTRPVAELKSLILWTIAMALFAIVILWCAYLVRGALLLIYVSGLLAVGFSPLVRLIERQKVLPIGSKRFPRWLAILIIYSFILGFLALVAFLIVPTLVSQARALWTALPNMVDRAQQALIDRGILGQRLTLGELVARAPGNGDAVGTVAGGVVKVVGGIFGIVTILILTFYILVDADRLRASFLHLFPPSQRERAAAASSEAMVKVSAWLGGQLLLGFIIGASSAVGLWALGIPFFYVLALISGIGELIPVAGPILSAIPAVGIAATISMKKALFVTIFFVLQQQVEGHVLVPKVMSRQVGVTAVTILAALLIGGQLLGIVGAILAVPTAAVLQVLFMELTGDNGER